MYWYFVLPFHGIVFRGMLAGIQRDAVRLAGLGESGDKIVTDGGIVP